MRLFRRRSGHREDKVRHTHAPTRRELLRASAGALPLALGAGRASAQAAYPSRPVKVVIPYPPAGGADTVGRILFQKLGEMWGAQFVVDNRGGAGGTIAAAAVAKAEHDG
jgi:tripartite-type tricarboxylate transporter receptor subunit TctC